MTILSIFSRNIDFQGAIYIQKNIPSATYCRHQDLYMVRYFQYHIYDELVYKYRSHNTPLLAIFQKFLLSHFVVCKAVILDVKGRGNSNILLYALILFKFFQSSNVYGFNVRCLQMRLENQSLKWSNSVLKLKFCTKIKIQFKN